MKLERGIKNENCIYWTGLRAVKCEEKTELFEENKSYICVGELFFSTKICLPW